MDDLYIAAKDLVVEAIKALGIEGWAVESQLNAEQSNVQFPCIVAISEDLTEKVQSGDSMLAQYSVPVAVLILDNPGRKAHEDEAKYSTVRHRLIQRFHQRRAEDKDLSVTCTVDPRSIINVKDHRYQNVQSSFVVWCEAFETRSVAV